MPSLTSRDAAAVLQVSFAHLHRLAQAVGVKPDRVAAGRLGRGYRYMWGARHLFALSLLHPLAKLGVAPAPGIVLVRGLAEQPSDETLEAVLADRPFAHIVAPHVCPHTVDETAVRKADAYRGEELRRQGRSLTAVDLRPMLADLQAQIRVVMGEGADVVP